MLALNNFRLFRSEEKTALKGFLYRQYFSYERRHNLSFFFFLNMCCSNRQTRKVLDASTVLLPWHSPTCSVVTASRCAFSDWQFSSELQLHTCSFPASSVRSIILSLRRTWDVETDARHGQLNLTLSHRYLPEPVTMKPSPSGMKHRLETALNV